MKFEPCKKETVNGVEVVTYDDLNEREKEVFSRLADLITKTLKVYTCIIFKAYTNKEGIKLYRVEVNGLDINAHNFAKKPIRSVDDIYMKGFFYHIVTTIGNYNYYKFYDESND